MKTDFLFVYGTLKSTKWNSHFMEDCKFIENGKTLEKYPLLIDSLPYLIDKVGYGHNVQGEVWQINPRVRSMLDALEGHPNWYERKVIPIELSYGKMLDCWCYLMPDKAGRIETMDSKYFNQIF